MPLQRLLLKQSCRSGSWWNELKKSLPAAEHRLLLAVRLAEAGEGLSDKPGQSRRSAIHPLAKTLAGMAAGKRHQSTRKLFQRLTRHGYSISRSTVHRYLPKPWG